jgi:hypothetical protein
LRVAGDAGCWMLDVGWNVCCVLRGLLDAGNEWYKVEGIGYKDKGKR